MLITVADLQREPVRFDTSFPPAGIEFGEDVQQRGPMEAAGVAELLEEHRGPKEIVQDIRLRGTYKGSFQVPCARCLDPVAHPLQGTYDVLYRPVGVDSDDRERAIGASETEIGYYQDGRCSCPCRRVRFAGTTARASARIAGQTGTAIPAPAKKRCRTRAGRLLAICAAGSRLPDPAIIL